MRMATRYERKRGAFGAAAARPQDADERQRSLSLTLDDVFDDLFVWRQGRDELKKLCANTS